jgi:glycosyltransferase involved in cell wall biosynthesis
VLKVRYHAHQLELSGYGRAAAGYIEALDLTGEVDVEVVPFKETTNLPSADVAIYHSTPNRLAQLPPAGNPGEKRVAVTTWETEPFPEPFKPSLSGFDKVIVPSTFCADLLRDLSPVVIPHGFDPEEWVPSQRTSQDPDRTFTFYSIGAWGERKNNLGLIKAYLHAFTKADNVRLVLIADKVNFNEIHSLLARSLAPKKDWPGMVIPDQRLSDEEIISLHRDGDCFVSATRAEGFGLPLFEAAIMGRRVIAPGWGGHTDFLRLPSFRKVWHAMTPVFPGAEDVTIDGDQMFVSTTVAVGSDCKQKWAEPSLERLAFEMRMTLQDFREGLDIDYHGLRLSYEKEFNYEAIGRRFLTTLKEI